MKIRLLAAIALLAVACGAGAQPAPGLDILRGVGKVGPYPLSWSGLEPASETVWVNGQLLFRLLDYTVDYQAGAITFARPLRSTDMARLSYRLLPTGKPRASGYLLPLSLPMGSLLGASLAMDYLFQGEGERQSLVLGLQAQAQGEARQLSSSLLIGQGQLPGQEAARALGLKLIGRQRLARTQLTASLLRADAAFPAGQQFGLAPGQQVMSLAGEYQASGALRAITSFSQADDISGKTDASTRTLSLGGRYQPGSGLAAGATHTQLSQSREGATTSTTTRVYDLAWTPPASPQVRASRTTSLVQREGQGAVRTVTDDLSLGAAVAGLARAQASQQVMRTDNGCTTTTRFNLAATVVPRLAAVKADYASITGSKQELQASAALELSPVAGAQMQASVAQSKRPGQQMEMTGLAATLKPAAAVSLGGSVKRRDYGESEIATKTASLTLTPVRQVELATEYSENPEDASGVPVPATASRFQLATTLGSLRMGGSYGERKELAGAETRLSEVNVSVALGKQQRIYSGYRLSDSLRPELEADSTLYRLGYSHNAGANFSLSLEAQLLQYRENEVLLPERSERRAEAKLNARF